MTVQNTTVELPVINDATEEQILSHMRSLHALVSLRGAVLPAFDDMSEPTQRDRIWGRATRALSQLSAHRREAAVSKFRASVAEVVSPYVNDARSARASFEALSADVRRFLPKFPETVSVKVSEVAHIFGEGTPESQIVKYLHTLGYKVSKKDNTYHIVAELDSK